MSLIKATPEGKLLKITQRSRDELEVSEHILA